MLSHAQIHVQLRDLIRLMRVDDYGTFTQLLIGYYLAGGTDMLYVAGTLAILAPCIYGGLYAINDAHDASADCHHPIKCSRPVAAGRIRAQTAYLIGGGLISIGVGSAFLYDFKVLVLAVLFISINLAYTFRLKSVPYVEIIMNTITHPLRFAAGLWLAGSLTDWTLFVAWTLAVFVITTLKRVKEMREASACVRPVLQYYTEAKLITLMSFSAGILLGMWPFTESLGFLLTGIWIALTSLAVLGYYYVPAIKRLEERLWR